MKKVILCVCVLLACYCSNAQSIDPVSLIIAKVIKAVDLKIQKMQNATIWLQQAQQVAENELSKAKLSEIKGWQDKQVELYQGYFQELATVKPVLKNLPHIRQILTLQAQVAQEYSRFAKDATHGTAYEELMLLSKEIMSSLQQLLSNNVLIMKDADRLMLLCTLRNAMADCLDSIKALNKQAIRIAASKARMQADIQFMNKLNGRP